MSLASTVSLNVDGAKAYAVGKALHLAVLLHTCLYSCAKKYPAHNFSNARVVMKLNMVVSCHVKEVICTKGGRLALHEVLAGKLCFTFIYIHSWNHY